MKNCFVAAVILTFLQVLSSAPAWACDPCALYNASRLENRSAGSLNLSLSEQYTNFDKADSLDEESAQEQELVKGFSTSQFGLAYDFSDKLSLQFTLPLIARSFKHGAEDETDHGIGDISLIGNWSFLNYESGDFLSIAGASAGFKLPTGETDVLENLANENEEELFKHHPIASASGGRALTFGSGSYDYILGLNFYSRYQRYLLLSNLQYTIRTEGDFDYEFADDYLFSFGPAYYFLLENDFTVAGGVMLSGEFKGKDKQESELVSGSQISNYYIGPQLLFTIDDNLSAELSFDFRISGEDLNATVVPETRLRAGLAYRF